MLDRFDEAEEHLEPARPGVREAWADQVSSKKRSSCGSINSFAADGCGARTSLSRLSPWPTEWRRALPSLPRSGSVALEAWSLQADTMPSLGRWAEAADAWEKAMENGRLNRRSIRPWRQPPGWRPSNPTCGPGPAAGLGVGRRSGTAAVAGGGGLRTKRHGAPRQLRLAGRASRLLDDVRLAHAKQPLQEPWRLACWRRKSSGASGCRRPACGRRPRGGGHLSEHQAR